jgi:hypothetical protein
LPHLADECGKVKQGKVLARTRWTPGGAKPSDKGLDSCVSMSAGWDLNSCDAAGKPDRIGIDQDSAMPECET